MKNRLVISFLCVAMALFMGFVAAAQQGKATGTANLTASQKALLARLSFTVINPPSAIPAFEVTTPGGAKFTNKSAPGALLILNFWATWCPPCKEEMPSIEKLYQATKADRIAIAAVDLEEEASVVGAFIKAQGYTFPVYLDSNGKVGATYGIRAIPTTYLVFPDGRAFAKIAGSTRWDNPDLIALLKELARP